MLLLLLLLMLFVVPVVIIPFVETPSPAVTSKEFAVRFLLPLMLASSLMLSGSLRRQGSATLVEISALLFVAAHVVSTLFSGRFWYCLQEHWYTWGWILAGLAAGRALSTVADLQKVAAVVALTGVLASLYGLSTYGGYDVLRPIYPFVFDEQGGRNYIHSFFGNPEYFGGYAAPVAVLSLSRAMRPALPLRWRTGWFAAVLTIVAALALSGSRGAFLGFAVAVAIILLVQIAVVGRAARILILKLMGVAAAVAVAGAVIFSTPNPLNRRDMQLIQRFQDIFNPRTASVRERLLFYSLTADSIGANPVFGAGPGTFQLDFFPNLARLEEKDPTAAVLMAASEIQNRVAVHAHNDYLEYWYELGTLGMAALLLVAASLLVQFAAGAGSWRATSREARELVALRTGFFAAALCLFINGLFSFPLHMPARGTLAWALIGCFLAADRLMRRNTNALAHGGVLPEPRSNSAGE